jgi:hypothetical protein
MDLILLLLLGWGITSTVINGSIFDPIRNYFLVKSPILGKLLVCVRCLGFWVGTVIFIPLLAIGIVDFSSYSNLPFWFWIISMPIFQSNFGVLMESFLIYLLKGTKSNI